MQFEIHPQDAQFIINVLGKLPTETGAFPIHQQLVAQFNAQSQPPAQPVTVEVPEGTDGAGGTD